MTAVNTTNVILSKNGLTVTIATAPTDEENLTKSLILVPVPTPTDAQETDPTNPNYGPNDTLIIDILNKVEQRITIDGWLTTGVRTVAEGDSSESAEGKKADLKNIFLGGGAISMTYESTTFDINMDKLSIKRMETEGLTAPNGVAGFSVKFTAIRGDDFGT